MMTDLTKARAPHSILFQAKAHFAATFVLLLFVVCASRNLPEDGLPQKIEIVGKQMMLLDSSHRITHAIWSKPHLIWRNPPFKSEQLLGGARKGHLLCSAN
jgi:hypothetical protein